MTKSTPQAQGQATPEEAKHTPRETEILLRNIYGTESEIYKDFVKSQQRATSKENQPRE